MKESDIQRAIEFEIPEQTPLLNQWQRWHWAKRRQLTNRFSWLVRQAYGPPRTPIESCIVEIERHCSGILPDWDGLYGGLKPILDCLVVATSRNPHGNGIIRDDNPNVIKRLTAIPVKSKRGEHKTVVRIQALEIVEGR